MSNDSPEAGIEREQGVAATDGRELRLQQVLDHIRQSLASLRFGQIVITVQDGVVVQIDRTEKTRLR